MTRKFVNTALNSGLGLIIIRSKANGSIGGIRKSSPKSPMANSGFSLLASAIIHDSILLLFLEHGVIDDAEIKIIHFKALNSVHGGSIVS